MIENQEDDALLGLIAQGDRVAFTKLYSRHLYNLTSYIKSICYSNDLSLEIVQETFIKVWINRNSIVNVTHFKTYLFTTARNSLFNVIRKQQSQGRLANVVALSKGDLVESSDNELLTEEYHSCLVDAINTLPPKRREIFKLKIQEELTLEEIAQKMNISKNVVKKQYYSGFNSVREYLLVHADIVLSMFLLTISALFI